MTFSILRALHGIIGDALDEIETVYTCHGSQYKSSTGNGNNNSASGGSPRSPRNDNGDGATRAQPSHRHTLSKGSLSKVYASPPPSPCIKTEHSAGPAPKPRLDFPSLDAACDPSSLSETLTQHPDVISATNRIIAACGQMAATLQTPFMTLCDAIMQYHLPSCMRLFEASNTPEILREAGPSGLHVDVISEKTAVEKTKLAHILRLLATHHIVREVSPDIFALNRISSTIDTGKDFRDLQKWAAEGMPEKKYENTSGLAAFVGLCTDEIFKSSAFLTEAYLLSSSKATRAATDPTKAPFCVAFGTVESQTEFFGWLEGHAELQPPRHPYPTEDARSETEQRVLNTPGKTQDTNHFARGNPGSASSHVKSNPNRFRLERFGKAMSSTSAWETPDAILNSFDWHLLPRGSLVVDVGGGVGSTSMLLARAFSGEMDLGLKFVIQDRPGVTEIGKKTWKAKCPEFLENGTVRFQAHDFYTPQPIKHAEVFLLRVVIHDWPDHFARQILLHLREAATPNTKLLLGDFILPLACAYETGGDELLEGIQGVESLFAPPPLLPNFGKANSMAYWMDLTMGVVFNAQERTLQEIVKLATSAGWQVTRVTKCSRSLFGYIVAVVDTIPPQPYGGSRSVGIQRDPPVAVDNQSPGQGRHDERDLIEPSSLQYGTPAFDTDTQLSFAQEVSERFDVGEASSPKPWTMESRMAVSYRPTSVERAATVAPVLSVKKRPSPLSLVSSTSPQVEPVSSSSPASRSPGEKTMSRWGSLMNLRALAGGTRSSQAPSSPRSPLAPTSPRKFLLSRSSLAQLRSDQDRQQSHTTTAPGSSPRSFIPVRCGSETTLPSLASCAAQSPGGGAKTSIPPSPSPHAKAPHRPTIQESQNRTVAHKPSFTEMQPQQSSPSSWRKAKAVPVPSPSRESKLQRIKSVPSLLAKVRQQPSASSLGFEDQNGPPSPPSRGDGSGGDCSIPDRVKCGIRVRPGREDILMPERFSEVSPLAGVRVRDIIGKRGCEESRKS